MGENIEQRSSTESSRSIETTKIIQTNLNDQRHI